MEAVALLIPNEGQTTTVAFAATPIPSFTALFKNIKTSGSGSTSQGQGTAVAPRRCRRRHHRDEARAINVSPYGFTAEWLDSSSQPLRSIDLQFNSDPILALNFPPDGSFVVSSGSDKRMRLWKIDEILGGNADSRPIQMQTQHGEGGVSCVTVSPNNRSILSGGFKQQPQQQPRKRNVSHYLLSTFIVKHTISSINHIFPILLTVLS